MIIKDFEIDIMRRALGHELMLARWQQGISQKQAAIRLRKNSGIIDRTELGKYTYFSLIRKMLILYNKDIKIELVDRK